VKLKKSQLVYELIFLTILALIVGVMTLKFVDKVKAEFFKNYTAREGEYLSSTIKSVVCASSLYGTYSASLKLHSDYSVDFYGNVIYLKKRGKLLDVISLDCCYYVMVYGNLHNGDVLLYAKYNASNKKCELFIS